MKGNRFFFNLPLLLFVVMTACADTIYFFNQKKDSMIA
jgi:hypothetical protein